MTLDYTTFVPVVGYPIAQKQMLDDYDRGEISFAEACFQSAFNSAVYTVTMIAAAQSNYLAAMQFQRLMTAAPMAIGVTTAAIGVHALTTPSADIERGPFGSVKVTPRLGVF